MKDFSKVPYLPLFDSRSKEGLKCPLFGVFTVRSIQYAKITYIVRVKPLQNCQLFWHLTAFNSCQPARRTFWIPLRSLMALLIMFCSSDKFSFKSLHFKKSHQTHLGECSTDRKDSAFCPTSNVLQIRMAELCPLSKCSTDSSRSALPSVEMFYRFDCLDTYFFTSRQMFYRLGRTLWMRKHCAPAS